MSIKEIINKSGKRVFQVRQSRRHPVTGKPLSLLRLAETKMQAERIEKQLVDALADKIHRQLVPTWERMLEIYERYAKEEWGNTEKTVSNALCCVRAVTSERWKNCPVDRISKEEIRQVVATRLTGKSERHQDNILKFIRSVFRVAEEMDFISKNPTPVLKFKPKHKLKTALNHRQASLLLAKAKELNSPWYAHWCVALYSGLRNGELFALRWEDVALEERRIEVRRSWNNIDGFKGTKSGDERAVYIADELLQLLRELQLKAGGSEFVLPRLAVWNKGGQAKELRRFLVGIGLPPIRFHDLRATWATLLLNGGVEPAKVMVMGGWRDYKTMMIYIRRAGIDIAGATNALHLHNPLAQSVNVHKFAPSLQVVVSG